MECKPEVKCQDTLKALPSSSYRNSRTSPQVSLHSRKLKENQSKCCFFKCRIRLNRSLSGKSEQIWTCLADIKYLGHAESADARACNLLSSLIRRHTQLLSVRQLDVSSHRISNPPSKAVYGGISVLSSAKIYFIFIFWR